MLLTFVVSALICGLITFAYPAKLYLETKKIKIPFEIVVWTGIWGVGLILIHAALLGCCLADLG